MARQMQSYLNRTPFCRGNVADLDKIALIARQVQPCFQRHPFKWRVGRGAFNWLMSRQSMAEQQVLDFFKWDLLDHTAGSAHEADHAGTLIKFNGASRQQTAQRVQC